MDWSLSVTRMVMEIIMRRISLWIMEGIIITIMVGSRDNSNMVKVMVIITITISMTSRIMSLLTHKWTIWLNVVVCFHQRDRITADLSTIQMQGTLALLSTSLYSRNNWTASAIQTDRSKIMTIESYPHYYKTILINKRHANKNFNK